MKLKNFRTGVAKEVRSFVYADTDTMPPTYVLVAACDPDVKLPPEDAEKLALMFAAAPKMLAALKVAEEALSLHQTSEDGEYNNENVIKARGEVLDAIAKAEGRE